jgi:hypothetical protein
MNRVHWSSPQEHRSSLNQDRWSLDEQHRLEGMKGYAISNVSHPVWFGMFWWLTSQGRCNIGGVPWPRRLLTGEGWKWCSSGSLPTWLTSIWVARDGELTEGSLGGAEVQIAADDVGVVASYFGMGMSKLQGSVGAVKGWNSCGDLRRRPGQWWLGTRRCLAVRQRAWRLVLVQKSGQGPLFYRGFRSRFLSMSQTLSLTRLIRSETWFY